MFDDAPQRVAVVLVPCAPDASCRASVTAASAFRTIHRAAGVASEPPGNCPGRRSRAKDPLLSHLRLFDKADVGTDVFAVMAELPGNSYSRVILWPSMSEGYRLISCALGVAA
jgi:hypothetical protein